MSLFVCDRCNTVDSTGVTYPDGLPNLTDPQTELLCSECLSGKWHGIFEKQKYNPEEDVVINRSSDIGLG